MNDEERRKQFQSGSKAITRLFLPRSSSETSKPSYAALENKKPTEKEDSAEEEESFLKGIPFVTHGNAEHLYSGPVSFKDADLHPHLLRAFETSGHVTTTEVQTKVLNFFHEYSKSNLKICGPRKCGKTTAVLMYCMNRILKGQKSTLQFLVVCPTLDLAESCHSLTQTLNKFCHLNICYAVKGKSFDKNANWKDDVIVATPEKALEIGSLYDLKRVRYFFIDDADCLSNPRGHFKGFTKLCPKLSSQCQIIVTTDLENDVADEFLKGCKLLCTDINIENTRSYRNIKQYFAVYNHPEENFECVVQFLKSKKYPGQAIICCEGKTAIGEWEEALRSHGAVKLTSDLSANMRHDVLHNFNQNRFKVLITTRSFLRGVDSENVTLLINAGQLFDSKKGLTLAEYDRRKSVLTSGKPGVYISFIKDEYQEFFFADKEIYPNGKAYFHGSEITPVENLKKNV